GQVWSPVSCGSTEEHSTIAASLDLAGTTSTSSRPLTSRSWPVVDADHLRLRHQGHPAARPRRGKSKLPCRLTCMAREALPTAPSSTLPVATPSAYRALWRHSTVMIQWRILGLRCLTCHRAQSCLLQCITRRQTRFMCSAAKMAILAPTITSPGFMISPVTAGLLGRTCLTCAALRLAATVLPLG